ncbi:MAG TPA: sulfite exporter TauE/SafE family protein [Pirellulaceae bacterium]|nr:sulfite exporter TauE/SafE family protein [Pirellulaceae bacterium]
MTNYSTMFGSYFWLCVTAFLAGVINALAGGGTLLTFPALTAALAGLYPLELVAALANGTSTIALMPASLSSAWAYRQELHKTKRLMLFLIVPSIIGGVLGALAVRAFPKLFDSLVPWLILTASLLFLIQPYVAKKLGHAAGKPVSRQRLALIMLLQFGVAIYGGYFGAGIGILMLSALGLMGLSDIHEMNALKTVLGSFINGTAVVVFLLQGNVVWQFALPMIATSILGGYVGAKYGRRVPAKYVRYLVICIGFCLTTYYFWKRFG